MEIRKKINKASETKEIYAAAIIVLVPLILLYYFLLWWFPMVLTVFPKSVMPLCLVSEIVARVSIFFRMGFFGNIVALLSFLTVFLIITMIQVIIPERVKWLAILFWLLCFALVTFLITAPRIINFYLPIVKSET